ncbi:hypothetical protein [Halarsenatibacter silvermanii]|uniref:Uncharacterized protein n=1 Tax=Halarsenatibacter silvermanii TaxID=321763 RepID=A0A1G9SAW5_9FIRM|nr:hypothetical protein [Halarsenatibacter silvermanii]SDM32532.1 hypothetical protein SAMN04488692_12722 [Halarsenatibacter silvermanii]
MDNIADNKILEICKEKNINISSYEKIKGKGNLYKITAENDNKYVIKKADKNSLFKNLKIINESHMYYNLYKQDDLPFELLKIEDTNYKDYIIFEYLDGKFHLHNIEIEINRQIDIFFSLQTLPIKNNFINSMPKYSEIFINIKFSPLYKTIRRILKGKIFRSLSLRENFKLIKVIFSCLVFPPKSNNKFIIHNDAQNIAKDKNDKKYLYDLETAIITRNILYLFIDVIHLAINQKAKNIKINYEIIIEFIKKYKKSDINVLENHDISQMIRFALIERFVHLIVSDKTIEKKKNMYIEFLRNVVLDFNKYKNWLQNNFGDIEVKE